MSPIGRDDADKTGARMTPTRLAADDTDYTDRTEGTAADDADKTGMDDADKIGRR